MRGLCSSCHKIDFDTLFFTDLADRTFQHKDPNYPDRTAPVCSKDGYYLGTVGQVGQRAREGCKFCHLVLREKILRVRGYKWPADAVEGDVQEWRAYLSARNTVPVRAQFAREPILERSGVSQEEWDQFHDPSSNSAYLYTFLTPPGNDEPIDTKDSDPVYKHLLHPLDHSSSLLRRIKPFVDFQMLRHWLNSCQRDHERCEHIAGDTAELKKQDPPWWFRFTDKEPFRGAGPKTGADNVYFRLVDVEQEKIVHFGRVTDAPEYAALSFVWGSVNPDFRLRSVETWSRDKQNRVWARLPVSVPATINDALKVVPRLGLRYLWVDYLCIAQDNERERRVQIQDMISIYTHATLCIIAAAGNDANAGLPGVTEERSGRLQQAVQVRPDLWVGSTGDARHSIYLDDSTWDDRAWTFQEYMLSRRLLIFTEEEVYYHCGVITACESVMDKAQKYTAYFHTKNFSERGLQTYSMMLNSQGGAITRWDLHWYQRCLSRYSRRTLTYDSDILNAFAGLSTLLERQYHTKIVMGLLQRYLLNCLVWEYPRPLRRRMIPSETKEDRPLLPSWTWAAWEGQVALMNDPEDWTDWVPDEGKMHITDPLLCSGLLACEFRHLFATSCSPGSSETVLDGIMPIMTNVAQLKLICHKGTNLGYENLLLDDNKHLRLWPNTGTELASFPTTATFIQICVYQGHWGEFECLLMHVEGFPYTLHKDSYLLRKNSQSKFRPIPHQSRQCPLGYQFYMNRRFKREEQPSRAYNIRNGMKDVKMSDGVLLGRRLGLASVPFSSWMRANPQTKCVLLG